MGLPEPRQGSYNLKYDVHLSRARPRPEKPRRGGPRQRSGGGVRDCRPLIARVCGKYLAVNAYACELLGYDREELLALRVTDVAVNPSAAADFEAMQRQGTHTGRATLRSKDGQELSMHYRAGQTTVGGMPLYIGVCWPVDAPA